MKTRFPHNDIISLLDTNLEFNMAESTPPCVTLGELLNEECLAGVSGVRLNYGTSRGSDAIRSLIANDVGVTADEVLVTTGGAAALFLTVFCTCEAGDEVIATTPNFPPTLDIIRAVGAVLRPIELAFENAYRLHLTRLETALNANTKLLILTTPQNPSGVSIPRSTITEAVSLAKQKAPNAFILVDESYRKSVYDKRRTEDSLAGHSPRLLTIASLSKCHGAPGIRIGWVTCPDKPLMDQLVLAKMNVAISCSTVDEFIAGHILRNEQPILSRHMSVLSENLEVVRSWVSQHDGEVEWIEPDAGALCCIRLNPSRFDENAIERFYALAGQHQIQLGVGEWFGESRRVFRLGFGFLDKDRLELGLVALTSVLRSVVRT